MSSDQKMDTDNKMDTELNEEEFTIWDSLTVEEQEQCIKLAKDALDYKKVYDPVLNLEQDPITVPGQNYAVVSWIGPTFKGKTENYGFRIMGAFGDLTEARVYAMKVNKTYPMYDTGIMQMNHFCLGYPDPSDLQDSNGRKLTEKEAQDKLDSTLNEFIVRHKTDMEVKYQIFEARKNKLKSMKTGEVVAEKAVIPSDIIISAEAETETETETEAEAEVKAEVETSTDSTDIVIPMDPVPVEDSSTDIVSSSTNKKLPVTEGKATEDMIKEHEQYVNNLVSKMTDVKIEHKKNPVDLKKDVNIQKLLQLIKDQKELDLKRTELRVNDQEYAILTFVSASGKNRRIPVNIKGVFPDLESAEKHIKQLMQMDDTYDIVPVTMYSWIPCDPDLNKIKQVHTNEVLNEMLTADDNSKLETQRLHSVYHNNNAEIMQHPMNKDYRKEGIMYNDSEKPCSDPDSEKPCFDPDTTEFKPVEIFESDSEDIRRERSTVFIDDQTEPESHTEPESAPVPPETITISEAGEPETGDQSPVEQTPVEQAQVDAKEEYSIQVGYVCSKPVQEPFKGLSAAIKTFNDRITGLMESEGLTKQEAEERLRIKINEDQYYKTSVDQPASTSVDSKTPAPVSDQVEVQLVDADEVCI